MKKTTIFLFTAFFFVFSVLGIPASAFSPANLQLHANSVILYSTDTGAILYQKNAEEKAYPASLTKLMTAVITIEHVTDLEQQVTIPDYCISSLYGTDSSTAGLKGGEQLTVRQLLYCLLVSSANDAANVLADLVGGGDIDVFVSMMNEKAAALGMTNTHFVNPHGLQDEEHYTTASDLLKLSCHILTLPALPEICSTTRYTIPQTNLSPQRVLATSNLMMDRTQTYYYSPINGLKTGYTDDAGRCLISTASKNGYHYLAIVLGCPPKDDNGKAVRYEYQDTKALYQWAFETFEYRQLASKNDPVAELPLQYAWDQDYVQAYLESDVSALIPKGADDSTIMMEPVWAKSSVQAPVKKGDILGYAKIMYAGEEIARTNLITGESISRNYFSMLGDWLSAMIHSTWFWVVIGLMSAAILLLVIVTIIQNKRRKRASRVRHRRRF